MRGLSHIFRDFAYARPASSQTPQNPGSSCGRRPCQVAHLSGVGPWPAGARTIPKVASNRKLRAGSFEEFGTLVCEQAWDIMRKPFVSMPCRAYLRGGSLCMAHTTHANGTFHVDADIRCSDVTVIFKVNIRIISTLLVMHTHTRPQDTSVGVWAMSRAEHAFCRAACTTKQRMARRAHVRDSHGGVDCDAADTIYDVFLHGINFQSWWSCFFPRWQ